jgi:hypothetical protein
MKRFLATLFAVVLVLTGELHPSLVHARQPVASVLQDQFAPDSSGQEQLPSMPGKHEPRPSHDGQVGSCAIGGCGLCGVAPAAAVMTICATPLGQPGHAWSPEARPFVPLLRPPILHA